MSRYLCATMIGMATDWPDAWTELHVALGLVVMAGARLEDTLRQSFSQLDDGEYSDIVAAGQEVSWLIGYCGDVANANPRLDQPAKDVIRDALAQCRDASQHRNELIHGWHTWPRATGHIPVGWGFIGRSRRHKPTMVRDWMVDDVRNVSWELHEAANELERAVHAAVGPRVRRALLNHIDAQGRPWPF